MMIKLSFSRLGCSSFNYVFILCLIFSKKFCACIYIGYQVVSCIQWNLVNTTTFGPWKTGRINGVVVLKGLKQEND